MTDDLSTDEPMTDEQMHLVARDIRHLMGFVFRRRTRHRDVLRAALRACQTACADSILFVINGILGRGAYDMRTWHVCHRLQNALGSIRANHFALSALMKAYKPLPRHLKRPRFVHYGTYELARRLPQAEPVEPLSSDQNTF